MTWVSVAALYFILWWLVLFATLPFGLKTQDEDEDVTLGTVSSAPKGPHMLRAFVRTTIISALILGAFYALTKGLASASTTYRGYVPDSEVTQRHPLSSACRQVSDCTKKMQGTRPCNLNASDLFPVSGGSA